MEDSQNFHDFMMNEVVARQAVLAKSDIDWKNVVVNNNTSEIDTTNLVNVENYKVVEVDENISVGQLLYEAYTT
jgi:hypothetical protein